MHFFVKLKVFLLCSFLISSYTTSTSAMDLRTTYDLNTNYIKYTGLGPLNTGVSNLMPIGLTLPGGTSSPQVHPITYSGIVIPTATANLQPQPGFLQNALGSFSSGSRPNPSPSQEPLIVMAPVSATVAMDTTLGMDSTGNLISAHEEYLHVFGSNYNPAMASAQYGSDAYHGLTGETVQETIGPGGTQDTVGYLAGATSQLYNIATMGDQNQGWTNGYSDASGMGNVVQHSNSNQRPPLKQKLR